MVRLPHVHSITKSALSPGQEQAANELLKMLAVGGAAGAGLRGISGIGEILSRNLAPRKKRTPPLVVDIPYRAKNPDEEDVPTDRIRSRQLGSAAFKESFTKRSIDEGDYLRKFLSWAAGAGTQTSEHVPWGMASKIVGTPLAFLAAHQGTDKILDMLRKRDVESELDSEKKRYRAAMMGKFKPLESVKFSADLSSMLSGQAPEDANLKKTSVALDGFLGQMQKHGSSWLDPTSWDMAQAASMYAAIAAPAALGAGTLAYSYTRQDDPEQARAEAMRKQLSNSEGSAPPIYARLVPVGAGGKPLSKKELRDLRARQALHSAMKESHDQSELKQLATDFVDRLVGRQH